MFSVDTISVDIDIAKDSFHIISRYNIARRIGSPLWAGINAITYQGE